ncbi:MAG: type II toxin-antitoxin system PemK/MazF family toxin, partial [Cyclobacteriaceae bacterium]
MYRVGDVVLCNFPYREDPTQFTKRPALVMKVTNAGLSYMLAQITSTNRTDSLTGFWIEVTSKKWSSMGLKNDSFINLSNILEVPSFGIIRLLGTCEQMQEIENK